MIRHVLNIYAPLIVFLDLFYNDSVLVKRMKLRSILFLLIAAALLGVAGLVGISVLKDRHRPRNVPSAALYGDGGVGWAYWIDCKNQDVSGRYYCAVYTRQGDTVLKGTFEESSARDHDSHIFYDGQGIHWKNRSILSPVRLDCRLGGMRTDNGSLPDCDSGKLPD